VIVPGTVPGAEKGMATEAVPGTGMQPKLETGTDSETEAEAETGIEADTVTQLKLGAEAEIGVETQATWPHHAAAADD